MFSKIETFLFNCIFGFSLRRFDCEKIGCNREINILKAIRRLWKKDKYHPYKPSIEQGFQEKDFIWWFEFCMWYVYKCQDENFSSTVIWTDETQYTHCGEFKTFKTPNILKFDIRLEKYRLFGGCFSDIFQLNCLKTPIIFFFIGISQGIFFSLSATTLMIRFYKNF